MLPLPPTLSGANIVPITYQITMAYARRVQDAMDRARDGMGEADRDEVIALLDEIEVRYGIEEREAVEAEITSAVIGSAEA
jgi:hypothetical protein